MSRSSNWIRRSTRWAIYHRDNFLCVYCQDPKGRLTLDHVDPDGCNLPMNVVTCCYRCNSAKQDKSLTKWYKYMREELRADTNAVRRRVRRALAKDIDRDLGRRMAEADLCARDDDDAPQ